MSLFSHDDHSRRLNRAKLQYENLLLHAGEVLVDKEDANASLLSATNASLYPSHSPTHSKFRGNTIFLIVSKISVYYSSLRFFALRHTLVPIPWTWTSKWVAQLYERLYVWWKSADRDGQRWYYPVTTGTSSIKFQCLCLHHCKNTPFFLCRRKLTAYATNLSQLYRLWKM